MIRQTMRSLALAAVGLALAGGAWGQTLRQSTSAAAMVAHEYFGASAGREVLASKFDVDSTAADQQRPYVGLTVTDAAISAGNVADITFTLSGATFSSTVAPANLDRRGANCAGTPESDLSVSVLSGGAKADSSVTFRAEATGELGTTEVICFWVPDLQVTLATVSAPGVMPAVMGVNVTASIATSATTGAAFPGVINGVNVDPDGDGTADVPGPVTDRTVFIAARALDTKLAGGGMALVNLADRTKIASGGTPDPSAADPSKAMMGLSVGTLTVMPTAGAGSIMKLDGSGAVATSSTVGGALDTLDASLGGQVMLSVAGPFQEGDKVVFGAGGDARSAAPSGGGAATSVALKITSGMGIVYVPGGTGVLKPSVFAAGAKYSFNSLDNNNALSIMGSTGSISYAGINVEGYAYGVVRGSGVESSVIRATCEAPSGECSVFLDCTDQDGMNYFGGPETVAAGATARWDSDAIARVIDGGWGMGRGRCDVFSTAPLAVQHMVRTGHGLINNSAVVGRSLDEGTDAAIAALRTVADNICNSVGMNDGTETTVTVDTTCVAVDTVAEP